jgi:hypothetical protein
MRTTFVAGLGLLTPIEERVAKTLAEGGISSRRSPGPMSLQAETGSNGTLTLLGMCEVAYSSAERRSITTRSKYSAHLLSHQGLTVAPNRLHTMGVAAEAVEN